MELLIAISVVLVTFCGIWRALDTRMSRLGLEISDLRIAIANKDQAEQEVWKAAVDAMPRCDVKAEVKAAVDAMPRGDVKAEVKAAMQTMIAALPESDTVSHWPPKVGSKWRTKCPESRKGYGARDVWPGIPSYILTAEGVSRHTPIYLHVEGGHPDFFVFSSYHIHRDDVEFVSEQ